jgi:hypothetical protein
VAAAGKEQKKRVGLVAKVAQPNSLAGVAFPRPVEEAALNGLAVVPLERDVLAKTSNRRRPDGGGKAGTELMLPKRVAGPVAAVAAAITAAVVADHRAP